MKDTLDLVRAVMALDPPTRIFGGVAEDALLHGRLTRPHDDVDVLVLRDELELRLAQAGKLGFREFHLRMESRPGVPLVGGCVVGDLNLEFIVFDRAPDGRVFFEVPVHAGTKRVWLPGGALDWPEVDLDGVRVRTLSPLALYHVRAAVAETFGGFRPKDVVAQAALVERFFAGVPEAELAPHTELAPRALATPRRR